MNPFRWLFRWVWLPFGYYMSWVFFGLGGLILNLAFVPLLLLPNRERFGPASRAVVRALFRTWTFWLHHSYVTRQTWHGFDRPLPTGTVYIASHPCLLDAPLLLGRLPDTLCIIKPALHRSPFTGPTAAMCGFIPGDRGVDLIREVADRLAAGQSLLIFPEGTRTHPGNVLNALKPGFALIAERARAPIQIIRITSGPGLCRKGHHWLIPPPMPGWIDFTVDEFIPAHQPDTAAELTIRIDAHLRSVLPPLPATA